MSPSNCACVKAEKVESLDVFRLVEVHLKIAADKVESLDFFRLVEVHLNIFKEGHPSAMKLISKGLITTSAMVLF